ncbi:AlpA family phage regulatory protein [Paraburkholderia sediminicola]|uniref:AlpA family phage regulatory protein n=1 Tax=Paraburkholderia sediminicola TaxID=458836 RepID=UPI0038B93B99
MEVHVKLSSGPLIEYLVFCRALAQAACPTEKQHFTGIECIVGKTMYSLVPMCGPQDGERSAAPPELQSVLLSNDGRTLDQLRQERETPDAEGTCELAATQTHQEEKPHTQVVELPLSYALNTADRAALVRILPLLPSLSYPVSQADETLFLEAYAALKDRPMWKPILVTDDWMFERKNEYMTVLQGHQKALAEEFRQGRLRAVDANRVPVDALRWPSFISRQQAISYLQQCGYLYDDADAGSGAGSVESVLEVVRVGSKTPTVSPSAGQSVSSLGIPCPQEERIMARKPERQVEQQSTVQQPVALPAVDTRKAVRRVIRLPRVEELTGLKHSTIYNRMNPKSPQYDPNFPRNFPLGVSPNGAMGWNEEEVKAWVAQKQAGNDSV